MKKINIIIVNLFLAIFLIGFVVSYKNFGEICESTRIVIIFLIINLSFMITEKRSTRFWGADSFTPPAHSCLINKNSSLFNQPENKPERNGNNNNNSNFKPEYIENPKPDNTYKYWHEPIHQSDSETINT